MDPGKGDVVVAVDRQGRATELVLGKKLGGGGEGTVFKVAQPPSFQKLAVKIFNEKTRPTKMPKVRAMLGLDPEPNTTWPLAVVHRDHDDAKEIGYGMSLAPGEELLGATNPKLREKMEADLDLFTFHRLAENLAKTVGRLHARGHVVGDLKDTNTTFSPKTLEVFLIDADSFGIAVNNAGGGFPAKIATPDWSPPESSGASALDATHDLFALAILYHWLLFATHPFSGTAKRNTHEDTTVNAIKEGRWIYGRNEIPPPRIPPFSLISPGLQQLFGCAFESGLNNPALRPAAAAWEAAFRDARYDLTWCGKHPLHVFDRRAGACPWCRLKPERWPTRHSPQSRTIGIAQRELRDLAMPVQASDEDLKRAERRLAANPGWKKDLPEVADKIGRFRRRRDEIDRALQTLRAAASDDVALIDAAQPFSTDAGLERVARATDDCGALLDRAGMLKVSQNRLQPAVDAAKPDRQGRFGLAAERELVDALRRETTVLGGKSSLLAQFERRRSDARERLEAAEALAKALADSGPGAGARLCDKLEARGPRLRELADEAVNGASGSAVLARHIVDLHGKAARPGTEVPDEEIVRLWGTHIAPVDPAPGVLDAVPAAGEPSLRQVAENARRSCAELRDFEQLLRSAKLAAAGAPGRDRAIVAEDPTARISPRMLETFKQSAAGKELDDALRRIGMAEKIERLAAQHDHDTADPALVAAWAAATERDQLGLSGAARARIAQTEERMARFAKIGSIAERVPPDDERLLAELGPSSDLLGLKLESGRTLREHVEAAKARLAMRDALTAAIADASNAAPSLESEERIAAAWNAADQARNVAPQLFERSAVRARLANLRVTCHQELTAALRERHGRRADRVWQQHRDDLSDFAPVARLAPKIEALLSRYRDFTRLREHARRHSGDPDFLAACDAMPGAFDLKDADEPIRSLGQRSLRQYVEAVRLRGRVSGELRRIEAFALDPGRLRAAVARIAEALTPDDLTVFESDGLHATLAEAVAAGARLDMIRQALANGDIDAFLRTWDETWHPLLSSTAATAEPARQMIERALATASFDAEMERVGDDRVRLSWTWPFRRAAGPAAPRNAGGGIEAMAIAFADRQAPADIETADRVVMVFRRGDDDSGHVEVTSVSSRLAANLFAGCMIAGEPVLTTRPVPVVEPKRRLIYRFRAATLGGRDDRLLIRSPDELRAPPLRIVHVQSQQTISVIDGPHLPADAEHTVDLRQLRASARGSRGVVGTFQRIAGNTGYLYSIELNDPADRDWLEVVHPTANGDRQLGFAWH